MQAQGLKEVEEIANRYNKTSAQVWLRWQLQQGIVVNPRTRNKEHMMENVELFDFSLTNEEMDLLSTFETVKKVWSDPCERL